MLQSSYTEQNYSSPQNINENEQTAEYEVIQFMKNFAQALQGGNQEEIATYYAEGAQTFEIPPLLPVIDEENQETDLNPLFLNQKISAEERFAVFSALVCLKGLEAKDYSNNGGWHLLTCVLDKTEGYWEIVQLKHGALI